MKSYKDFIKEKYEVIELTEEQILSEQLNFGDIKQVERVADHIFSSLGVDINIHGKHFLDRVNDARNGVDITVSELISLFQKTFSKWGNKIINMKDGLEAVINDINTDINLPFLIKKTKSGVDLIAKTVMRKKNFLSRSQKLKVW